MTTLPARRMRTIEPSERNSFGRRTAWLPAFMKGVAVYSSGISTSSARTRRQV
ncbi:MAG TPA: hypothetical protein VGE02_00825 [Gemmatimonadales bacterium]